MKIIKMVLLAATLTVLSMPSQANDTMDSVKSTASDAYDKTKEVGKDVGDASVRLWDKAKEVGGDAVEATRDGVTKFRKYSNEKVCEYSDTACKSESK